MYKPIVTLKQGKVRGISAKSVLGSSYVVFYEIPFAAPPIGELRFKDPVAPASWTGIRNCTVCTGKICAQPEDYPPYNIIGNEDCLYLNVYVNSLNQSKPVMFWIHGGAFTIGTGSYKFTRPDYLLAKDVVVVAPNYRLGAFGFLNLGHRVAPGNQGMKDLIKALQWVKENIRNFGGDPDNVTLIGHSAGGVIAHALTISPAARGLFHKAIFQSGFLTCSWSTIHKRPDCGFKLALILGIKSTDPEEIVRSLRKLPNKDIVKAYPFILTEQEKNRYVLPFGLNYDKVAEYSVLPYPIEQLCANDVDIPVLGGYTTYEGNIFHNDSSVETFKRYNYYLPENVKVLSELIQLQPESAEKLLKAVKDQYFGGQSVSLDKMDAFLNFLTDVYFAIPLELYINDRAKRTSAPNYVYRFSYLGKETTYTDIRTKRVVNGASHMDELAYLFYSPLCKAENPEPPANGTKDRLMMERLTTMWTNFARTGNPTPCQDNNLIKTIWEPTTKDKFCYLNIDEEFELVTTKLNSFDFSRIF
ncbi:esterase FE4-like [Colletes gigas]|uniref:esterase FE4-like n=1 Tax=Colletes gigas TaxID=935657 RepID=UPI001C9B808C|nr:esterase FE4-like [Colletes gigas]